MSAIVLRIVLLLVPVLALLFWLRWLSRKTGDESEKAAEVRRLRLVLLGLLVVGLGAGLGLYLSDDNSGDPSTTYVPSRVENGELVPGRFEESKPEQGANGTGAATASGEPRGAGADEGEGIDDGATEQDDNGDG
ncbi:hypothetical protein [Yunchengibacter salinarum]|uniref:hypothetical protein n=1 Tax=Yunchengibacter salinarum TaxID=3133399 RepID=UPI0035B627ED